MRAARFIRSEAKYRFAMLFFLGLSCFSFCNGPRLPDPAASELRVIRAIQNVNEAEQRVRDLAERYVSLPELAQRYPDLIPISLTSGELAGYRIDIELAGDDYRVRAIPQHVGLHRSFYSDSSGIIRQSWGTSVANSTSQPVR